MAYTVTWTLTRPNDGVAIPTIESFSADNKSANDTIFAENGVTKTYEIDELVTRVVFTAEDKATYDSAKALSDNATNESTVRADYKAALIAANITCTIIDSEGTTIASF